MKEELFEKINWDDVVKAGKSGYLYVTTTPEHPFGEKRKDRKKRYVYLHRAVMEKHLGRYLKPEEQVDHKDGNKKNNDISNLELKMRGEHQRDHANNGNTFWKSSPRTKKNWGRKKKTASAQRALLTFFRSFF